ncbi:hypothetical protein ACFQ10_45110 [Streptomyces indonesiensis]
MWGYARPGADYLAVVRLSSASGSEGYGATPDLRRLAVRVQAGPEGTHDLLATSFPVSHAADAHEFIAFAKATAGAGSTVEKAFGLFVRLPLAVGWATADRMRRNMRIATRHTVGSLARETFWSRGAILWGPAGPVRYQLRPAPGGTPAPPPDGGDPDYLHRELAMRLSTGDIAFELCAALSGRPPHPGRGRFGGVAGERRAGGPGRGAHRAAPGPGRRPGPVRGPPGRAAGVQPLAHHRGVPSARQPQPGP